MFIYSGFSNQHELVLHVENYFVIVKNIFVNSTSAVERLATLYLMYALYFKQPAKDFCKFRFTSADWDKVKHFYRILHNDRQYQQARCIFWRLWYGDAFRFVESDTDYYPDVTATNRVDDDAPDGFYKINGAVLNRIKDWQSDGIIGALETLEVGYNEMKEHLATTGGIMLTTSKAFKGVMATVDNVRKLFAIGQDGGDGHSKRDEAGPSNLLHESDLDIDGDDGDECDTSLSSTNSELEEMTSVNGADSAIGSRRYQLKRKALGQVAEEMLRLRSCINDASESGSLRSLQTDFHENGTETDSKSIVDTNVKNTSTTDEIEANRRTVNVNENGDIVINHPKKVFNRNSKLYISSAQRQMQSCPE